MVLTLCTMHKSQPPTKLSSQALYDIVLTLCTKLKPQPHQPTKLSSPVPEVVDPVHSVPHMLVQVSDAVADDGRAQVASVEWLGNVWRTATCPPCWHRLTDKTGG